MAAAGEAINKVKLARPERFELPTLCFEGRCSIQLSYGRVFFRYLNLARNARF